MIGIGRQCLTSALALMLAACGSLPSSSISEPATAATSKPLILALPPVDLGCAVAVQQRLTVQPPGQSEQVLEALLEVDTQQVQLAVFHLGQRMGVLRWDGATLDTELSRWWPAQLPPAQVLSDLQMALWPLKAVSQALSPPWSVQQLEAVRVFAKDGVPYAEIKALDTNALQIRYAQGGWSLRVDSPGGMRLCASASLSEAKS